MLSVEDVVHKSRYRWSNWSGVCVTSPQTIVYPSTVEEVVSVVQSCAVRGQNLRVVGAGHSFTPLAATHDVLMSLDRLSGLVDVQVEERTATVWAGTRLKTLGELLHHHGLAQENLGDIDVQSIAGAISTGTHGTGGNFGTIATQVIGLTVVLASGKVVDCSETSHPELFYALRVSLGALGVLVKVKLRLVPSFRMVYESRRMPLLECLNQLDELKADHRHFEFYWFPHTDMAQVKWMDETADAVQVRSMKKYFQDVVMENRVYGALSELCRTMPTLCKTVSRLSANNVPVSRTVDYSHRLFATQRLVRFNEMEYNLPSAAMRETVLEMEEEVRRAKFAVHFPVECRFVRGDDIWLSPAYQRDSAYIAVHMYKGMEYEPYFTAMERIFRTKNGRPHWGKLHTQRAETLAGLYPRWNDFQRIRAIVDPSGMFLNDYLNALFHPTP
ncbi:MAG: FAD-binding protein [Alicyclobacillaceae bacterium]|nr:FAD-binding protein [Alicyclobacillaceae bacterium]